MAGEVPRAADFEDIITPPYSDGAGANSSVLLNNASAWFQIPSAGNVPSSPYILIMTKEIANGQFRYGFDNAGTPGATNGNRMEQREMSFVLAGGQVVYVNSANTSDRINVTTKII